MDTADLNLVLAAILPADALAARAEAHLRDVGRLLVPFSVAIELLFVARRHRLGLVEALGACEAHFDLDRRDVLYTAAEALESGDVRQLFDALHAADALHQGGSLHTADRRLAASAFPTVGF